MDAELREPGGELLTGTVVIAHAAGRVCGDDPVRAVRARWATANRFSMKNSHVLWSAT
jgi:hypothetical protein